MQGAVLGVGSVSELPAGRLLDALTFAGNRISIRGMPIEFPPRHSTVIPDFKKVLHGGDYNPDQWLEMPEVVASDFSLMRQAGCNTFAVGIFAWSRLEPEEGMFDFDWLDGIMDRMASEGSRVILATPSGARPPWMGVRYEEVRRVNQDGLREPFGRRHNHCWTSPVYREKVRLINTMLAERYASHPALGMWHVSNEYGGDCYCQLCLREWHDWLREKYGTLDALNDALWASFWSHRYSHWTEVDPRDGCIDALSVDWRRFVNAQMIEFFEFESAPLRRLTPGIPVTTNFMGLSTFHNYAGFAKHVDVVADDQYPRFDPSAPNYLGNVMRTAMKQDLYRSLKNGRPFFLMESCPGTPQWTGPMRLKRPGIHRLEMLQAVAHGADGTCYFQWRAGRGASEKLHGAVVDHNNSPGTRVFREVAALGEAYGRMTGVLGTSVSPEVAIVFDWEARWGQLHSVGTFVEEGRYADVASDHYNALWRRGIPVDLVESSRDFSGYRLLIVPQLWMLNPGVANRLREFVGRGGTLAVTFDSGICDESNRCFMGGWPGDGLAELLGIRIEETDRLRAGESVGITVAPGNLAGLKPQYQAVEVCSVGKSEGAKVLAQYSTEFYAGAPALTRREWGSGAAWFQAARFEPGFYLDFYGALARDLHLDAVLDGALMPEGVTAQVRGCPEARYVFLFNFTQEPRTVSLGSRLLKCLETGAELEGETALQPFSAAVFQMLTPPK